MASLFSEALDFALPKAGKDSDFKLKTEQKLIIEPSLIFSHHLLGLQLSERISSKFSYVGLLHNLELLRFVQFVSAFQRGSPLSRPFRNY